MTMNIVGSFGKLFTIVTGLAGFLILAGCSPQNDPAVVHEKRNGMWLTDYEGALKIAAEQKKPVLLDFTGSDWCPPCKMLKKRVFDTAEFQQYAREKLVLVELDFPRLKNQAEAVVQQNNKLQSKYQVEGYPTVILLGPEGKERKRTVGLSSGGVKEFLKWVES